MAEKEDEAENKTKKKKKCKRIEKEKTKRAGTTEVRSVGVEMQHGVAWHRWATRERRLHTIFLMLGLLKLPALRCFWTWLAEPWRVRPLVDRAVVGDNSTFSLSIPGEC